MQDRTVDDEPERPHCRSTSVESSSSQTLPSSSRDGGTMATSWDHGEVAVRCPGPLAPGETIGVTSPSSGVPDNLLPRLDFCVEDLRRRGYEVVVGECIDGAGVSSAPPQARAAELTAMLLDPRVRVVIPPWGSELAVELLTHLDMSATAAADPAGSS